MKLTIQNFITYIHITITIKGLTSCGPSTGFTTLKYVKRGTEKLSVLRKTEVRKIQVRNFITHHNHTHITITIESLTSCGLPIRYTNTGTKKIQVRKTFT